MLVLNDAGQMVKGAPPWWAYEVEGTDWRHPTSLHVRSWAAPLLPFWRCWLSIRWFIGRALGHLGITRRSA